MVSTIRRDSARRFIPSNAARFHEWANALIAYITPEKVDAWNIPEAQMDSLQNLLEQFNELQNALPNDPNRSQIARRNEAQKNLTQAIRYLIRFYLRRQVVSDPDLVAMGIPPIDTIRTPHIVVTEKVDFVLHISGIRRVIVDFWQQGITHSKAKPNGYDGAVLLWHIADEMPDEAINFKFHTLASRTPHTIEFHEQERGKTVWVALAWQNARGIIGEWSEFKSAIIP